MRYLSVCSGIEAVSVAWQPLGWQPVMFAEIDPFCCWLLRSRYRASRPIFMPSPHDAPDKKEERRRAAAIRNIVALPADGDVINAGDFTRIGKADVGTIDLLAGGTPCQSFSIAGKRAGLDDPRGNLTIEFARLADRLRPVWVVWENVPGVLSIDGGRTFGAFLGMLVELGYGLAWRILDARYFGVPQRRRRVFVVGHLGDWRAASAVLVERACLSGHSPSRRETRQNIAPTLSARAHGGGGPGTDFDLDGGLIPNTDDISRCLNAGGAGRQDYETETLIAHSLFADGFDAGEDGTGRGTPMIPVAICTAHTQSNGSGFSDGVAHTLESGTSQAVAFNLRGREGGALPEVSDAASIRAATGGSSNSYVAFSAKDYGADVDDIAPTLRGMGHGGSHANGGGQVAVAWSGELTASSDVAGTLQRGGEGGRADGVMTSQMAVRRLTPRECERLQGFPDDYTLVEYRGRLAADGPRYKALGNSMAVPVMRWIGERIAQVDAILRERGVRRSS
ncbi:MAG TPA: DNA cytosine methyltransferase [Acidobacteriaceae bacterium]|nr:DNA cytosine methyltransferase [Acidobacteriaceae bacterium]